MFLSNSVKKFGLYIKPKCNTDTVDIFKYGVAKNNSLLFSSLTLSVALNCMKVQLNSQHRHSFELVCMIQEVVKINNIWTLAVQCSNFK